MDCLLEYKHLRSVIIFITVLQFPFGKLLIYRSDNHPIVPIVNFRDKTVFLTLFTPIRHLRLFRRFVLTILEAKNRMANPILTINDRFLVLLFQCNWLSATASLYLYDKMGWDIWLPQFKEYGQDNQIGCKGWPWPTEWSVWASLPLSCRVKATVECWKSLNNFGCRTKDFLATRIQS